ncbi:hypothetical protein [Paenibacillus gallinarum]|uniref:DUF4367 domain-containing protein n=1 Tax=Paenibacillus gallinarum TaxID=2762232 RepID=A0ABR8T0X1_9BACL|nr:hypothetical protein [Paenibacillus gallinarum]MBD7969342.1 hypothetical protein [Paenibacillus gallinarum]
MNNEQKVDQLIKCMQSQSTSLPDMDVRDRVMDRVHSFHRFHYTKDLGRKIRKYPVWLTAAALLFVTTVSVSAATFFKTDWNGIQVMIDGSIEGSTTNTSVGSTTSYKTHLDEAISKMSDTWKIVSIEEAEEQMGFTALRPKMIDMIDHHYILSESFGVLAHDTNYRVKSEDEWWLGGIYDVFRLDQNDVVVKQNLDPAMTQSIRDEITMSLTFQDASWENIEIANDALAMYTTTGDKNLLIINYKNSDHQVISIELQGNVTKEELIQLAKSYL